MIGEPKCWVPGADGWLHIAHCGDTRLVLVRDGSPPYAALTQVPPPLGVDQNGAGNKKAAFTRSAAGSELGKWELGR